MKTLLLAIILFSRVSLAEEIPARDPYVGESRPDWWWDIWHGSVVVLEGKIKFTEAEKPDLHIEFNEEEIERIIPDPELRELQGKLQDFYVGELEISKFHYADGGASDEDKRLDRMEAGQLKRINVLIPIQRFGTHPSFGSNLRPGEDNSGIHVFNYSTLILGLNFVHSSQIPRENLGDAEKVFQFREKLVHCGVNRTFHPDQGYAGFQFVEKDDLVVVEEVIAGTPAQSAGLKAGDTIVSINGEKIGDPDLDADLELYTKMLKLRVGDLVKIEVERGSEKHQFSLSLISKSELQKAMNSDASDDAKPKNTKPGQ